VKFPRIRQGGGIGLYKEFFGLEEMPFNMTPDPSLRLPLDLIVNGSELSVLSRSSLRGNPYGFPLMCPFLPQEANRADRGKIPFSPKTPFADQARRRYRVV